MNKENVERSLTQCISTEEAVLKVLASVIKIILTTDVVENIFNCISVAHIFSDERNHEFGSGNESKEDDYFGLEEGMAMSILGVAIAFIGQEKSQANGYNGGVIEIDDDKRISIIKKAFDGEDPSESFVYTNKLLGAAYNIRNLAKLKGDKESNCSIN